MKGNVRIFAYDVNSKIQNSPKVSLEQGFCVRRADVQIWSFVLLMNFNNKLKLCAPKPARTQSPKTSGCEKSHFLLKYCF